MPRLLFVSLGVPGLGGSSTAAFDLFRRLLADGVDAHFLNLVEVERAAFLEIAYGPSLGNPGGLPRVHTHRFTRALWDPQPELARWIDQLDPAIVVGVAFLFVAALWHRREGGILASRRELRSS